MHQYLDWLLKTQLRALIDRQIKLTLFWVKLDFLMNKGKSQLAPSGLPGVNPRPPSYSGVPKRKEGSERITLSGRISHSGSPADHNLAEVLGTSVQYQVICSYCGDAHGPPPALAPRAASQATDNPCPDLYEPGDRGQVEMVGGTSQPYGGPTFPLPRSDDDNSNARLHGGVGRSPRQLGGLRRVVDSLGQAPYQLARASGCMADLETLLAPAVDILSSNATTVAYINKEGRTLSPSFYRLALQVWAWCREHPVASHFSGSKNVLADALSRGKHHHPNQ